MKCPYCKAQLFKPDQEFCHNCKNKIKISNILKQTIENTEQIKQTKELKDLRTFEDFVEFHDKKKSKIPYSIKCARFAFLANLLPYIAIIFYSIGVMLSQNSIEEIPDGKIFKIFPVPCIIAGVSHIAGVLSGFLSLGYQSKAQYKLEPRNIYERAGGVFAWIGLLGSLMALIILITLNVFFNIVINRGGEITIIFG